MQSELKREAQFEQLGSENEMNMSGIEPDYFFWKGMRDSEAFDFFL